MIKTLLIMLFVASTALAYEELIILAEDDVVVLPDGHSFMLYDDDTSGGIQIKVDGRYKMKIHQNHSMPVGSFSIKCLRYDLAGDRAEITISKNVSIAPKIVAPKPITKPPVKTVVPKFFTPQTKVPSTKPSSVPKIVKTEPVKPKPIPKPDYAKSKQEFEEIKSNLNEYIGVASIEEYRNLCQLELPQATERERLIVQALYAWRLQWSNPKFRAESINILLKVRHLGVKNPFDICPSAWTPSLKTEWESGEEK